MKKIPYASGVGSLMYAMVCCRPDIAYAVSQVSRFMAQPGREHWRALKWIFRYLAGSVGVGICYEQRGGAVRYSDMSREAQGLIGGYVDADFDGDVDTRRSTTGFIFSRMEVLFLGDRFYSLSRPFHYRGGVHRADRSS